MKSALFPLAAFTLLSLAGSPSGPLADSDPWTGARLLRLDPSTHSAKERQIQVPVISYQPVPPILDRNGQLWRYDLQGTVSILAPYVGKVASWSITNGVEAPALTEDELGQTALIVDREGTMFRLDVASSTAVTVNTGLPVITGLPCREGVNFVWPDTGGGISVTDRLGDLKARYEGEIYRKRRIRGGSVAICSGQGTILAGTAGGKILRLDGDSIRWATTPRQLSGSVFARYSAISGNQWLVCSQGSVCVAVDIDTGNITASTRFGSIDGIHPLNGRLGTGAAQAFLVAGTDGQLHELDANLNTKKSVPVSAEQLWMVRDPFATLRNRGLAWVIDANGDLFRVQLDSGLSTRVFHFPSGAASGGVIMQDRTATILSNYGSLHVFELR